MVQSCCVTWQTRSFTAISINSVVPEAELSSFLHSIAICKLQYSLEILKAHVHAPSMIPELETTEVYAKEAAQQCLH